MSKKKTRQTKVAANYAIGVDYGTNSVRALVVDVKNGKEIGEGIYNYPSGEKGILLDPRDPNFARQNPADYIEGFYKSIRAAIRNAKKAVKGFTPSQVVGIGVDTTGSTPLPVDATGTPLSMKKKYAKNMAAYAWLWKDHTSYAEAEEITQKASEQSLPYLAKCGGTYSSEWFWSKILHCKRTAPAIFDAAHSWVELCDFIPAWMTGNQRPEHIVRSICAAGHKAMFNTAWGGLPSKEFLSSLDPALADLRDRLYDDALPSNHMAGRLTAEHAKKCGLPKDLPVSVGAFDAHMGAVGAGVKEGTLVKIMGTSTCDIMLASQSYALQDIPGLCGIVPGSVLEGYYGLEAGQSAVGDIFNWFVENLVPAKYTKTGDVHVNLTKAAELLQPGESGLIALDWNNGNRTVLVDQRLSGLLVGQSLHTTAPEVYRALIEATAYGALTIINRIEQYGVPVKEVINCGGIAEKNAFAMQLYADICNRPMKVSRSAQTCALGAAIFGAVVGGAYTSVSSAQKKMTGVKKKVYRPRRRAVNLYAQLYTLYHDLHDAMGTDKRAVTMDHVMKQLMDIRDAVRK